ncbi:MAG: hypothetical protein LKE53_11645 [Oscillospiraceae bacterium]|nr:hypothetical protein [Oscillospiraceae bacterium]
MKGNSLQEFMDDLLATGGPEKEFVFRKKRYFLETVYYSEKAENELSVDEIDMPKGKTYSFRGKTLRECVEKFENAPIFDGLTIYEAESEIEVLFG